MVARSTLFKHATIIAYDEDTKSLTTLRDASLLVTNDRITKLAEGALRDVPSDADIVDATDKIISPGFINTHHHMWQSAFRTLGANTTLSEYFALHSQLGPTGKHFTPDDVYLGQMACALEMIDGGTTTILDHAHAIFTNEHIDAVMNANFRSGLRIFAAHTIQDIKTTGYTPEMGIEKLFKLSKDPRFADTSNPVQLGASYDGWAFAPREFNGHIVDMIIDHNNTVSKPNAPISVLTTHHVAGPFSASYTNGPSLLDSLPNSALAQEKLTTPAKLPIIFSHASFMTYQDARLIRAHPHVSISTTPESEAHFGHTSSGAELCQDCASLGVDTHFTFSSYMPFQSRIWLQSLRAKSYRQKLAGEWEVPLNNPMSCEAAFLLMTQKGGQALGKSDLGVIKVGAQADLVMFDTKNSTSLWGVHDPVAAIVLHTTGAGDIEGVMVQGKWLEKNHKLVSPLVGGGDVTVDDIRDRFKSSASRIQKIWARLDPVVLQEGQETMPGAKYGKAKMINVVRKVGGK